MIVSNANVDRIDEHRRKPLHGSLWSQELSAVLRDTNSWTRLLGMEKSVEGRCEFWLRLFAYVKKEMGMGRSASRFSAFVA
jgi:hypothetical protein